MAGLVAALDLVAAGLDVVLLESADRVGGRVVTDHVDGFRLDRGFQVLNTSYPQVRRRVDLAALDVRALTPGALVRYDGRLRRIANPLRQPSSVGATLASGLFGPLALVRLGAYSARAGVAPARSLTGAADMTAAEAFARAGLGGPLTERFLVPFLAGVLLEDQLETGRHFVDLAWRSFVRGRSVLPVGGIGALPAQLADRLPPGVLRLATAVTAVRPDRVDTAGDSISARAVVVAADPVTAAGWLGHPTPDMRSVTTFFHATTAAPLDESTIVLDGDRSGPVINSVVLTAALPEYAPTGTDLVSSSVLDSSASETDVRAHLARMYGCATDHWQLVARVAVPRALPAFRPGQPLAAAPLVGGVYVAGDHRATPSTQGAMASGTAIARQVLRALR